MNHPTTLFLAVEMATNHGGKMEIYPMTSTNDETPARYVMLPERTAIRVPRGFGRAACQAAAAENCRPSDYLRRVMLDALKADGFKLNHPAA